MKKHTFNLKAKDCENRVWYLVDVKDKVLGRVSTRIARILIGKHKPTFTPHLLCGDAVIVINGNQLKITGNKMQDKIYKKYTGYPGGLKEISMEKLQLKKPEKALRLAVKGMLPRSKLGKLMLRNLKIYSDDKHPHVAQGPVRIDL